MTSEDEHVSAPRDSEARPVRMPKFDPNALMRLAIDEMHKSVPERRDDGKVPPSVGAVVWFPDGTVVKAHRSEFREGDHAEFTVFEKKLLARKLDEAVLFTTLEPCLVRSPERTPCAKRIFKARMKQVWIGIEDPDPSVEGRGQEYLIQHEVDVRRFPEELYKEIEEANQAFIKQATDRANVAHTVPPEGITLSSFEAVEPRVAADGFSADALRHYRRTAKIKDATGSPAFLAHLAQLGLLRVDDRGRFMPTKFGVVAFGKDPQALYPMATVLGKIRQATGQPETRTFLGPAVLLPDEIITWLRDRLPQPLERSSGTSKVSDALPYEAVREAIVNAIVHRDYDAAYDGVQTHLEVTPDTVIVKSAGAPKAPSSIELLQELRAVPVARNPALQATFARARLTEGQNYGMETFRALVDAGLPRPTYSFDEPFVTLTLYRTPEAAVHFLPPEAVTELGEDAKRGWVLMASRGSISSTEYARGMQVSAATALRHLRTFARLGLVTREGSGPATRYRLVPPSRQ